MKNRLWPIVAATAVLTFGSLLPVYAAENQSDETTSKTEEVNEATPQTVSSSLLDINNISEQTVQEAAQQAVAKAEAAVKAAEQVNKEVAAKIAAKQAEEKQAEKEQTAKEAVKPTAQQDSQDTATETPVGTRTLTMESTAYSSDPADALGGGTITATGQNLLTNPMAVAVDPSVIPLGTHLYVEGYGEAYAVDTGSAIQGNIIDVHFSTADQCYAWGRRSVQVTILS